MISISVVIPTCNRPDQLRSVLGDLARSTHPIVEVIVVDSSDDALPAEADPALAGPPVRYLRSRRSVCVQRNVGINEARGDWIFLCDDDLTVPPDYLALLAEHLEAHAEAGAVTGRVLEQDQRGWQSEHPIESALGLYWRYLFQLGVWGEIRPRGPVAGLLADRYRRRGNHISRAGWPVIVDFSGAYFRTPIYGLGASLVKREWLLASPYDERLDAHGIGDNYGVAIGFPAEGIHVVNRAHVYHHRAQSNRLRDSEAYGRRLRALHHFISTRRELAGVSSIGVFLWSLAGQVVFHTLKRDRLRASAALDVLVDVVRGDNPYLRSGPQP